MANIQSLSHLELLTRLQKYTAKERLWLASVIECLAELHRRKSAEEEGYPSLYAYCTQRLGYSEGAAYKRIQAARLVARYPKIIDILKSGKTHLAAINLIAPHLTDKNYDELMLRILNKSKREIELIIASIFPRKDKRDHIQSISSDGQQKADRIEQLSAERVHFGFSGSAELLDEIEQVRDRLRHKFPAGRLEDVFKELVSFYLNQKDPARKVTVRAIHPNRRPTRTPRRLNSTKNKRESRNVPRGIKSEVWKRDGGRCTFVGRNSRRCNAKGGLEFDHIRPWARGGTSKNSKNIRLLCRSHNQLKAFHDFGIRIAVKNDPRPARAP